MTGKYALGVANWRIGELESWRVGVGVNVCFNHKIRTEGFKG